MKWKRPDYNTRTILLWDLTNQCNLRCKHCYNGHKYFSNLNKQSNIASYQKVLDNISQEDIDYVHFLGGEPLMHPNIFNITKQLNNKGIKVGVNTNGMLLNKFSGEIKNANFDQIVVSLESPNEKTHDEIRGVGVFNTVKKGLESLEGIDAKLVISWTLTKKSIENLNEIENMLDLCEQVKAHTLIVNWLFQDGFAEDNKLCLTYKTSDAIKFVDNLVNIWKRRKVVRLQLDARPKLISYLNHKHGVNIPIAVEMGMCKGARTHYMLRANGELFPCAPFDSSYGEKYKLENGFVFSPPNLERVLFSEAVNSDSFSEWKNKTSSLLISLSNKECVQCEYNIICHPCPLVYHSDESSEECKYI